MSRCCWLIVLLDFSKAGVPLFKTEVFVCFLSLNDSLLNSQHRAECFIPASNSNTRLIPWHLYLNIWYLTLNACKIQFFFWILLFTFPLNCRISPSQETAAPPFHCSSSWEWSLTLLFQIHVQLLGKSIGFTCPNPEDSGRLSLLFLPWTIMRTCSCLQIGTRVIGF